MMVVELRTIGPHRFLAVFFFCTFVGIVRIDSNVRFVFHIASEQQELCRIWFVSCSMDATRRPDGTD